MFDHDLEIVGDQRFVFDDQHLRDRAHGTSIGRRTGKGKPPAASGIFRLDLQKILNCLADFRHWARN
jgi:hypothetical protein